MSATSTVESRVLASRLYFGAAGALAVSTFLPWWSMHADSDLASGLGISGKPSAGGMLYLLLFAAAYGFGGYAVQQRLQIRHLTPALWALNAWMLVNVLVIASGLHDQNAATSAIGVTMHPSLGVFVAVAAVAAGIAGSVVLRRAPELVAPLAAE
jgi:hypothetical protein